MAASIKQLETQLANAANRNDQVNLLNELAYAHRYLDIEKTRALATQALQLASATPADEPPLRDGSLCSRIMLSVADLFLGNYEAALLALSEIETQLSASWVTPRTHVWAVLQLGQCHMGLSNYPVALGYFLVALTLSQQHHLRDLEYYAYLGLGTVYAQLDQFAAATAAETKAVKLAHELNDASKIFMATSNLAVSHIDNGDGQKALELIESAMPFFTPDETASSLAYADITRAQAYGLLDRLDLAEPLIEGVLRSYADSPSKDDLAEALQVRAQLYEQASQLTAALDYYHQALGLAEQVGNKDRQAAIHQHLAGVYRQLGQLVSALDHFEAFHRLHTAIFNEQADLRLKSLEIMHRTATARQDAEMLQQQKAELELRVASRTVELEEALTREQAIAQELARALTAEEQLSRLKSQIITTVSHEFRTPLAIISSSVEMLTRFSERLTEERKIQIERRIYRAVFALRDFIQDIVMVDATHNRDITPQLTTLPFAEFCRDLAIRLRDDLSYPAHLNFEYEPLDTVMWIDEGLLRQVVFDLLSNAIKYSPPDYPITVTLDLVDNLLTIVVTDQGIGIPSQDIGRIFQLFFRGSNVSTRSGLGLGLYIVDKLVRAMQGTIVAESLGPEQGSTFRVVLPVKTGPVGQV